MMDFYNKIEMVERDHVVIGLMPHGKLAGIAQFAGLCENSHVIDFGCGYGDALFCWATTFWISGVGIDSSEIHIEYAKNAKDGLPVADRIDFMCTDATTYRFEPQSFDLAACIAASNMFGEADIMFGNAIRHMKEAITDDGYLLVVEPYYIRPDVPKELIDYEGPLPTEIDLIHTIQGEGFELVYMVHSNRADWDRYISSNLFYNVKWLTTNRNHPEWQQRLDSHRRWQEMYVRYRSRYEACVALLMTRI
jgi:SAM-dependent methyltransferase